MEKKLEVLITSGGTISKMDDVRHIGNFSNGTTGALIAEEVLRKGAKVYYLHAENAVRPFRRNLTIDPLKPFGKEAERVKKVYDEFQEYKKDLVEYSFLTFENYYVNVRRLLTENKIDVVILAAAVSDYSAEQQKGKISSDKDKLNLELIRNPKVISLVKEWKPDVFQVGFKLLSGVSNEELIEAAYKHGMKNRSNLTVANTISDGDFRKISTYIISPEKEIIPVKRKELAKELVEVVYRRLNKNGKTN